MYLGHTNDPGSITHNVAPLPPYPTSPRPGEMPRPQFSVIAASMPVPAAPTLSPQALLLGALLIAAVVYFATRGE